MAEATKQGSDIVITDKGQTFTVPISELDAMLAKAKYAAVDVEGLRAALVEAAAGDDGNAVWVAATALITALNDALAAAGVKL